MSFVNYWNALYIIFTFVLKTKAQEVYSLNRTYDSPIIFHHQPEPVTYCSSLSTCLLKWEVDWNGEEILMVTFEKNGQPFGFNEYINGTSLEFKQFSLTFVGVYVCVISFGNTVIRSSTVTLKAFTDKISLVAYPSSVGVNESVMLSCWEETSQHPSFHIYAIKWYKDNKTLIYDNSVQVIGKNKLLLANTRLNDQGYYQCSIQVTQYSHETKSVEMFLNITDSFEEFTTIVYKSADQTVKWNSMFTIECLARHASLMHIVKEVNGKLQVLVTAKGNFANYTIKVFDKPNVGSYLCEAIGQHISREYVRLDIGVQPIFAENGFVENIPVYIGYSTVMECNFTGSSNISVNWYKNGSHLLSESLSSDFKISGTTLSKKNIDYNDLDFYQCVVENNFGSVLKYFFIYSTNLQSGVQQLKVVQVTSSFITFEWLPPLDRRASNFIYIYSWTSDLLKGRSISTEKNTIEKSVTIRSEVFGGVHYKIGVCLFYQDHKYPESCVYTFVRTPEGYPINGPLITSLNAETLSPDNITDCSSYFCLRLTWINPPWFSNGEVKYYLLKALSVASPFAVDVPHNTSLLLLDNLPSDISKTLTIMNNDDLFKLWMTSTTSFGEGPMSNSFLVSKNSLWDKDVYKRDSSVNWESPYDQKDCNAVVEWKHENFFPKNKVIVAWLIYYIPIPFSNYWKSVKIKRYNKDKNYVILRNLNCTVSYRVTIAAVLEETLQLKKLEFLGNVTHLILEKVKFKKFNIKDKKVLIQPPNSLKCVGINENEILVSWSNPPTIHKILYYIVYISNETYMSFKTIYQTDDHYLKVDSLQPHTFYTIRVIPKGILTQDSNISFLPSQYISCQTKILVSSAVTQAEYYFSQRNTDGWYKFYLIVRWKEPLLTGDGVYIYKIYLQPYTQKHIQKYIFDHEIYYVFANKSIDGWIYSPSIIVHPKTYAEVSIIPINGAGEGISYKLTTRGIDEPDKTSQVSLLTTLTPESSFHINNGIAIGLSIAGFFMLVLFVTLIIKNPCKSTHYYEKRANDIKSNFHKELVYLKPFDEQNSASTSAACQGCGGVCTANICENSRTTISKFIVPLWRLLGKPIHLKIPNGQTNQIISPYSQYDVRSIQFSTSSKTGDSFLSNQQRNLISTSRS
ncbi:uncharacterized protein LOC101236532 isoform X2 [Hydra vulgaris]|uniref:Uncharacterized protein LOC101236532 isoform X2 n=1 Tax=Hydra vulgaris TaxID=6087 RepID=A0ABM4C4L3_HYDVU